jgi:zinc protease
LVYYVGSSFNIGLTRGVYQAPYACDPPNVSKARAIIVSNLKQMQAKKVTAQELKQAKLMLLRDIPLAEASTDSIAEGWLGRTALGLPLGEPVLAGRIYLKLTAGDVQTAFKKWIRPDDLVQVVQGPAPK